MIPTIVTNETSVAAASTAAQEAELRSSSFRQAYHEVSESHVVEVDVVEQLRANMAQLEDLHARLRFMMAEVSYLLRKG